MDNKTSCFVKFEKSFMMTYVCVQTVDRLLNHNTIIILAYVNNNNNKSICYSTSIKSCKRLDNKSITEV